MKIFSSNKVLLLWSGILIVTFLLFIASCSPADQDGQIAASSLGSEEVVNPKQQPSTTGMSDQDILKEYPDSLDSALTDLDMVGE